MIRWPGVALGATDGRQRDPGEVSPGALSLVVLLLAVAAALTALYPSGDPDVYFHLAAGRQMVESGGLPDTEPFCFPAAHRPFVNHEWLFDVALWLGVEWLGTPGVVVFKALLAALLFGLVALVGRRMGAGAWPLLLVGSAFLPLFRESLEARPHLAGYALAAATILSLFRLERGDKVHLAVLTAVMILWVNTHGSFPLALLLWGVFAARALIQSPTQARARGPVLVAGPLLALACLANPWGPALLGTVFHHLEPAYRELVPEWRPIQWGSEPARDLLYLILVASALLSFLPRMNRGRVAWLAILGLFLFQATLSAKFILGLAIGAVPVLASNLSSLGGWTRGRVRAMGAVLSLGSLIILTPQLPPWQGFGLDLDLRDYPDEALGHAAERGLKGRLFNPFNHGGFCEFISHPDLRTYIDGRAYVHGIEGIRTYLGALASYREFKALHQQYGFDLVLADLQDPSFPRLLAGLSGDPRFALVWLDSHFALFVPITTTGSTTHDLVPYEVLLPTTDPRYLFDLGDDSLAGAQEEIRRVLSSPGGRILGRLLSGVLELRRAGVGHAPADALTPPRQRTHCQTAFAHLEALVESRPDTPMFRYFLAVSHACAGRCERARRTALEAGRAFSDAVLLAYLIEAGGCTSTAGTGP